MFSQAFLATLAFELAFIAFCVVVTRRSELFTRAPGLDIALGLLVWIPWIVATTFGRAAGLAGCVAGQFIALQAFCIVHTQASGYRGGNIRRTLDRIVGPTRNHLGLWATIPALPVFLGIRVGQVFFYPMLVVVLDFPRYRTAEWINISRQKFKGLVGHDLVWCLYCDWMTGVYSLGAEMLRNVESFWCPIRFCSGKKCDNCKLDFPDVNVWVPPDGTMKDVEDALSDHYSPKRGSPRGWWAKREPATRMKDEG